MPGSLVIRTVLDSKVFHESDLADPASNPLRSDLQIAAVNASLTAAGLIKSVTGFTSVPDPKGPEVAVLTTYDFADGTQAYVSVYTHTDILSRSLSLSPLRQTYPLNAQAHKATHTHTGYVCCRKCHLSLQACHQVGIVMHVLSCMGVLTMCVCVSCTQLGGNYLVQNDFASYIRTTETPCNSIVSLATSAQAIGAYSCTGSALLLPLPDLCVRPNGVCVAPPPSVQVR